MRIVFSLMNFPIRIFARFSKLSYSYSHVSTQTETAERSGGISKNQPRTSRSSEEKSSVTISMDFGGSVRSGLPSSCASFLRRSMIGLRISCARRPGHAYIRQNLCSIVAYMRTCEWRIVNLHLALQSIQSV